MARLHRILYASDFSPASRKAFAAALNMARTNRAAVTIVHVLSPILLFPPDAAMGATVWEEIQRGTRVWAEQRAAKLVAKAKMAGVRAAARILEGDPADLIVRAARAERADLIVLGTHGRSGLPRFLLGSVADRVLRMASQPVMTVRGR